VQRRSLTDLRAEELWAHALSEQMREPIRCSTANPPTSKVCSADLILLTPLKCPLTAPKQIRARPVACTEICRVFREHVGHEWNQASDHIRPTDRRGADRRPFRIRTLQSECEAHYRGEGADLIVTGGYGHSRLGEWMFGGMTRGPLKEAPVCVMMSH
jgi:hypothetical protein